MADKNRGRSVDDDGDDRPDDVDDELDALDDDTDDRDEDDRDDDDRDDDDRDDDDADDAERAEGAPVGSRRKRVGAGTGTATRTRSKDTRKRSGGGFIFGRLARFVREIVAELQKVIWPTRKELLTYTTVVVVFVAIMMTFVSLLDVGFARVMLLVFGGGNGAADTATTTN